MKAALVACVLLGLAAQAFADEQFDSQLEGAEGRFLFFNSSSTATSLTLLGALILLGVIAYLVYAGGIFGGSAYNRNDYYGQGYDPHQDYYNQAQYRSADDMPYQMNFKILEWISLMKDLYENFDYNDLDCQKRLICEVMKEPEFYGNVAKKFKAGFEYASFLDYVSIPDDMRELLDEYMDANARADQQKECAEYFPCNFSVKDQFAKTFGGNHL